MKKTFIFLCVTMMPALLYSKVLISLVMIGLFLLALFSVTTKPLSIAVNPKIASNVKQFFRSPPYYSFIIIILIVLLTGVVTDEWFSWFAKLRIKLPFLILPFAFWCLPKLSQREFLGILLSLLIVMTIESILILGNFILNFDELYAAMKYGNPIPTPINHIRYSVLSVISVLAGWELWKHQFYIAKPWEKWAIRGMTVFMILFIHFLSVRTGWVCLYLGLGYLLVDYIIKSKKWLLGVGILLAVISLPVIAVNVIPSVNMKYRYMVYDWEQSRKGETKNYSDSQRLTSYKLGIDIGLKNPILGVGYGDVSSEMNKKYEEEYPNLEKRITPHNQFIYYFVGSGFIGLALFVIALLTPLYYKRYRSSSLFMAFFIVMLFSLLPENTFETSIGTAIYLFFILLFMNRIDHK